MSSLSYNPAAEIIRNVKTAAFNNYTVTLTIKSFSDEVCKANYTDYAEFSGFQLKLTNTKTRVKNRAPQEKIVPISVGAIFFSSISPQKLRSVLEHIGALSPRVV